MNLGVALGAALGGLARAGYFALGLCTLALPLAAILVWCCRPRSEKAPT
jgi:predicted MFS family arabinose efflux permease